jgi:hypothetical protein
VSHKKTCDMTTTPKTYCKKTRKMFCGHLTNNVRPDQLPLCESSGDPEVQATLPSTMTQEHRASEAYDHFRCCCYSGVQIIPPNTVLQQLQPQSDPCHSPNQRIGLHENGVERKGNNATFHGSKSFQRSCWDIQMSSTNLFVTVIVLCVRFRHGF